MRAELLLLAVLLAAPALAGEFAKPRPALWRASSSLAVSPDGRWVAAANPESDSVTLVRSGRTEERREVRVGRRPSSVCFTPDGLTVLAADRGSSELSVVRVAEARETRRIPTGALPSAVLTDGKRAFVSESGQGSIAVLELGSGRVLARAQVGPFPEALALSPDGRTLLATQLRSGRLTSLRTKDLSVEAAADLGPNAGLSLSIAVSPDGRRAYLPQTVSNSSALVLNFDTMLIPVVSVVELPRLRPLPRERLLLGTLYRGANRPSAAVVSGDGSRLFVAAAGSGEVFALDARTGDILARLEVGAEPAGLALSPDGSSLYVDNALDGTLSVVRTDARAGSAARGRITHPAVRVDLLGSVSCRSCHASGDPAALGSDVRVELAAGKLEVSSLLWSLDGTSPLTKIPLAPEVLRGKRLFNSSRPSMADWISCASCHPDGGTDGRTWAGDPNGPRNTQALFDSWRTPPLHWSGDLASLYAVEGTFRTRMFGRGLLDDPHELAGPGRSEDLDALVAYLSSLEPPASPFRERRRTLARGRKAFESAGCASCHPAPLFTDQKAHDTGIGEPAREKRGMTFDTPSLRALWLTAPYFHDGSAPTLEAALRAGRDHDVSGRLSPEDLKALAAYLRSL